jgi:hypothetical protein
MTWRRAGADGKLIDTEEEKQLDKHFGAHATELVRDGDDSTPANRAWTRNAEAAPGMRAERPSAHARVASWRTTGRLRPFRRCLSCRKPRETRVSGSRSHREIPDRGNDIAISAQQATATRIKCAIVALILTILPWISVIAIGHEYLPGSIALINGLFVVALVATYFGCWSLSAVLSSSPRLMFMRALATTLIVMTCLLILEAPAMLKLVDWAVVMRKLSGEGPNHSTAFVPDKDLAFRRIPNLHWSARPASDIEEAYLLPRTLATPITFTYDRWGYRNTTEMERASIVLIGDSYVEGWYVSDEQTVASRLAHRLGQRVANLGVAGYGTMQELRVLKGDALARKPKVIAWFFFEGNDLYDDDAFEWLLAAAHPWQWEPNWQHRSFTNNAFRWIRRWSHFIVPNRAPFWGLLPGQSGSPKQIFFNDGGVPWTEYEESRWEKAKETFRKGIEEQRG